MYDIPDLHISQRCLLNLFYNKIVHCIVLLRPPPSWSRLVLQCPTMKTLKLYQLTKWSYFRNLLRTLSTLWSNIYTPSYDPGVWCMGASPSLAPHSSVSSLSVSTRFQLSLAGCSSTLLGPAPGTSSDLHEFCCVRVRSSGPQVIHQSSFW